MFLQSHYSALPKGLHTARPRLQGSIRVCQISSSCKTRDTSLLKTPKSDQTLEKIYYAFTLVLKLCPYTFTQANKQNSIKHRTF